MSLEIDGVKWFLGGLGTGMLLGWLLAWWSIWHSRLADPPADDRE